MTFDQQGKLGAALLIILPALMTGLAGYSIGKSASAPATESRNQMEGYYDPVNKVMCYWIKDSKATPACLYAEWPIEIEPTGTGDEEYSHNKEAARNATYHY